MACAGTLLRARIWEVIGRAQLSNLPILDWAYKNSFGDGGGRSMKTINATIGLLGLLASVMALSSLLYGAFQEPFEPYLQGVMGGVLDMYRTMRDHIFSGTGAVLSHAWSWSRTWLDWLPPLPWFTLSDWGKDLLSLYILIGGAYVRQQFDFIRKHKQSYVGKKSMVIVRAFFWPLVIFLAKRRGEVLFVVGFETWFMTWLYRFALLLLGCSVFFLLAYAENRIGF